MAGLRKSITPNHDGVYAIAKVVSALADMLECGMANNPEDACIIELDLRQSGLGNDDVASYLSCRWLVQLKRRQRKRGFVLDVEAMPDMRLSVSLREKATSA